MITLPQITKHYKRSIPRRIRRQIAVWIDKPEPQKLLAKALDYSLTDADYKRLYKIGNINGKYPRLYYLAAIYIHPLTYCQYVAEQADKLIKTFN